MKTTLPAKIETKEQAIAFLTELHKNGEAFHPEDDATDIYIGKGDISRLFTDEEADKLNELMIQIYDLDGNNGNHLNPEFDPCHVLLVLGNMEDLNNRELLNDILLNVIKRDISYTYSLERNRHTHNWELRISQGDSMIKKYDYSRVADSAKDIAKLTEFEILLEEEL